ncbi:MAG TPA: hypothetical protein VK103_00530 [Bacillota bacterium]|nr:hypothetical protein [Bacillota bacterium]
MTTRLRGPMRTVLTHRATFGTGPDGAPLAYAVSQGTDSPLSVVDLAGRRLAGPSLPGSTGAWGLVGGPDGQCWIGSYYDGRSYHWDGHRVHDLGRPTPETRYTWDLALTEDGTVLFGTYPDAALVAHHPERGFVLLRRFGTDEVQYLRSLCWDPQRRIVWCATGVTPNQVRGVFVDEPDREPLIVAGLDPTAVAHQLTLLGDRLFVVAGRRVWVADPDTLRARLLIDGSGGRLSEEYRGGSYFTGVDDRLSRLDLASLRITEVPTDGDATGPYGGLLGSTVHHDTLHLIAGEQTPELVQVRDGAVRSRLPADVVATPPHMLHVLGLADGPELLVSAGQQGQIARWNPDTDLLGAPVSVGQVESWCWYDGEVYCGGYPRASLTVWDPDCVTPPRELVSLHDSHHQSRPVTVAVGDGAAHLGTTPGYGLRDGALTTVDLDSGAATVRMFPDETVSAVAVDGDALLVGTSPEAGTGTPEHDGHGRLLRIAERGSGADTAVVPAPHGARAVTALTRIGDQWWLLADQWLCRFDPRTLEVTTAHRLADGPSGRGQLLVSGASLLTCTAGTVRLVDPATGAARVLAEGVVRMALTDRALWCVVRPESGGSAATDFLRIDRADLA